MPRATSPPWAHRLEKFLREKKGLISDYTARKYRREIRRTLKMLEQAGLETDPKKIGEKEISYLILQWREQRISQNYIIWRLNHLNLILHYYGNTVMTNMRMNLRPQERTHVRWLTEEDVRRIRKAAAELGPQYEIRIHLGLDLLLRKIEMYRLKVQDFERGRNGHGKIHILGKGRYGGKPADIPFHPDTEYYLDRYLAWREEQITRAMENGERIRDQDAFLIWYRPGMGTGKEGYTTMDNKILDIVKKVNEDIAPGEDELVFSYHDLRRTGAKMYWRNGWDLVLIQHLLRHEKIETTIAYLGLKYELLENALWAQEGRGHRSLSASKAGNSDVSGIPI